MKSIFSQIMGTTKVIFSIIWIGLGIIGMIYGLRGIEWTNQKISQNMQLVVKNIEVVSDLLTEIADVIDAVNQSLYTAEQSTLDAGSALNESRPLIGKSSDVITQDVPKTLDDIQVSMPSVIEAAATIDHTLTVLSNFRFSIPNPFGTDWELSLGVDYNPPIPLEEALANLGGNLEGLPESMRALEGDLGITDTNLLVMSENFTKMADNLNLMQEQISDINPEIERIISNLHTIKDNAESVQLHLSGRLKTIQNVYKFVMILFILSHLPSVYIGYIVATKQLMNDSEEKGERHVEI